MNKTAFYKSIILFISGTLSALSFAQTEESIAFGPADIIPTLAIQAAYDDNITSVETDSEIESDTIITISPAVRAQIDNGVSGFAFDYSLTKGEYISESSESFLDQAYGLSFGWNVIDRHTVTISADLTDSHDRREPDVPGFERDELDKFEATTYNLDYVYGNRSVFFSYELSAALSDIRYKTNRKPLRDVDDVNNDGDTTEVRVPGTALNDRETESINVRLNINPTERLQFSLLFGEAQTRYDEEESVALDSDQQSYGVGFSWDVSQSFEMVATFVDVNIEQDGGDSQRDGYDLSGTWSPLSYSQFTLGMAQTVTEPSATSTDGEDFVDVQTITAQWRHNWTDIFSSNLVYSQSESDFVGSETNRLDESESASLGLGYQLRRSVSLSFNVSHTSREGTETSPKSDRTVAQIGAEFTL